VTAYSSEPWKDLFVAEAGASAAILLALLDAILGAWVLVVEILR
jgi:hypothetical protein